MLREPWKALFPLGTVLAWLGVLPWLFFALGLRRAYEPFYGALAYRSFFHPLAELEGFLTCFAVGLLFTLLKPGPASWQVAVGIAAPIVSAILGATGQWELGLAAEVVLLAVALEFAARRVRISAATVWIAFGLAMGAGGALLAQFAGDSIGRYELGRDLVMQGLFTGLAIGIGRMLRGDDSRGWGLHAGLGAVFVASFLVGSRYGQHLGFALRAVVCVLVARPLRPSWEFGPENLRPGLAHLALWILPIGNAWVAIALSVRRAGLHMIFLGAFASLLLAAFTNARQRLLLAGTAALFALAMLGRAMVELDPTSFHLWMGISSGAFLAASAACSALAAKLVPS
ncbi:MAG: hypothetical protein ABR567_09120 [Myxococcales bacterium]|nr:hypothetical protein [Myxococcales bacterium]